MKCIFICVFNNVNYVKMLYMLLESIYIFGNLDEDTEILIYTSTEFMNMIKNSHIYSSKLIFETNDQYNDIDKSAKSRLDLFNLKSIDRYEKILYIDTDIIINRNISNIFDICVDECIYAMKEGEIDLVVDGDQNYWGYILFGDEVKNYEDKSAFSSGIMLFKNCEKIKNLFKSISNDIINRPYFFKCYDQPYFVYNCFKYNCYNNKVLCDYVVTNIGNMDHTSEKSIHHFAGGVGVYQHKYQKMTWFLLNHKNSVINDVFNSTIQVINDKLLPKIQQHGQDLLNYYINIMNTDLNDDSVLKYKNIINITLNKNIKTSLEIGGQNNIISILLTLMANKNIKVRYLNVDQNPFLSIIVNKINEVFDNRIILSNGDIKYDIINLSVKNTTQLKDLNKYCKKGTIVIVDNTNKTVREFWEKIISKNNMKNIDISTFELKNHDIKYL